MTKGMNLNSVATDDDRARNIAANVGINLGGDATMLTALNDLIDADDARVVQIITPETRQECADALRDAATHWGVIGTRINQLDDKLPVPNPPEDPNEP